MWQILSCTYLMFFIFCSMLYYCIKSGFTLFVPLHCKIVIFVAFTMLSAKMYATFNVLHVGALANVFSCQMFPIYFVCDILIATPYSFAFNHVILHISCILLVSINYSSTKSQNFLASATNTNAYKGYQKMFKCYIGFFLSKITQM